MDIETVREIGNRLPGVTEDIKWEDNLCLLVGEKIFCMIGLDYPSRVSFKVTPDQFTELTVQEGIIPAPYLARNHWIQVKDFTALSKQEWQFFMEQSYGIILRKLSKKRQMEILESRVRLSQLRNSGFGNF